jgi:O-antigen ligase
MKYFLFTAVSFLGIPMMVLASLYSRKLWALLITMLVFSTALGDIANINFFSMEAYRGPERGFEVNLTDIIVISLCITLLLRHASKLEWLPSNSLVMLSLFAISAISIIHAEVPVLSLFTIFKMLKFYLLYWCISNHIRCGIGKDAVIAGFILSALFIAILAIQQKYMFGIYRIYGPFDHSNTIPLYLNLFAPILLAWIMSAREIRHWQMNLGLLTVLAIAFSVISTYSRAGTALNLFAIISVIGFIIIRNRQLKATLISLILISGMSFGALMAADSVLERIQNAPVSSEEARDEFNDIAKRMASENLLGVGLNHFSYALTNNQDYRENLIVMKNEEQGGVAHHIYLLTAAEIGYFGLFLYLLMISKFLFKSFWYSINNNDEFAYLCWGVMIGLCTLYASGFFEWAFRITPVSYMFAITSGLMVGLCSTPNDIHPGEAVIEKTINSPYLKRALRPIFTS